MTDNTRPQEYDELAQMRQQLTLLQERLDRQTEISDRQMRRAVTSRVASLRSFHNFGIFIGILCFIFILLTVYEQGVRLPFFIATAVLFALNIVAGFFLRARKNECLSASDMLETARNMKRYKTLNNRYLTWAVPVVVAWAFWYVYEICLVAGYTSVKGYVGLLLCCIIGGVIGGLIGYFVFHKPAMKKADRIIQDIESISPSEPASVV